MQLQGVWMANFIEKFNPDLEWAAAPFPAISKDMKDVTLVESDILVIPKGSPHVEEAWEFIKFVQQQENMEMLCLLQKKYSPLREVSDEFYEKHPNPHIRLFRRLAESENAAIVPQLAVYNEYLEEMRTAYDNVWRMEQTPIEALQTVKQRIQPKMDRSLEKWNHVRDKRLAHWSSQ